MLESQRGFNLRAFWHSFIERIWIVVLCVLAGLFIALGYLSRTPKTYQSHAVLEVDFQEPSVAATDDNPMRMRSMFLASQEALRTIEQNLTNRQMLETSSSPVEPLRLTVEAHASARTERVLFADNVLRVWVRARAIEGQANTAIEQAIAEALGLRNRGVRLVSGARSRHKTVEVDIASLEELQDRLRQFNNT